MSDEFRNEVKLAVKEGKWVGWTIIKASVGFIIFFLILDTALWLDGRALGIFYMDIDREVIQYSQQYSETKVNLLNKLYSDYLELKTEIAELGVSDGNEEIIAAKNAQLKNAAKRIKTEAGMIPASQLPEDIATFLVQQ